MTAKATYCWHKCFCPAVKEKEDGEWIEPILNKQNERHFSKIEQGRSNRRASIRYDELKDRVLEVEDKKTICWSHLIDNMNEFKLSDLNDPIHDVEVFTAVNSADNRRDTFESDAYRNLSMGSEFSDDTISRSLGGFGHDDGLRISDGNGEDVEGNNTTFTSKTKGTRKKIKAALKSSLKASLKPRSSLKASLKPEMTFIKKRMTLLKMQEPLVDVSAMKSIFTSSQTMDSRYSESSTVDRNIPAISAIAVLSDEFFLTASRSGEKVIKMHRAVEGGKVEFVRDFRGHKTGVTALVTLDRKGRFLSAGINKTVSLWDSRFDCKEDLDEGGSLQDPMTFLATFNCFERWIHSIEVLNEGSFVRPTDGVDMAMVRAMAKKTALEGATSVQRAAIQREIIECSGSFATASKNDKSVKLWEMTVRKKEEEDCTDENVAKIKLAHVLEHDAVIGAMVAKPNVILTGDIMGVVFMWERKRRTFCPSLWTKIHEFTPWKKGGLHSPSEISEQSIVRLCLLDSETFVYGTKSGVVRVWDNIGAAKAYEVRKKHAKSAKVTSELVSGIQKLPSVKDPNSGEECLAFSVASTDGHVMSLALYPQDHSKQKKSELAMFHVYDNTQSEDDNRAVRSINSIAISEAVTTGNGNFSEQVLIAGDGNGDIKTFRPEWASVALF